MNYRIALMPYLNNRAFFHHRILEGCELVKLTPREAVNALKRGHVQAGVVPVAGLKQLGERFELIGSFGIASDGGPVKSVLFFSQQPFELFTSDNSIKLSSDSLTSINLLKLLFGYQQGFSNLPVLANRRGSYEGELLIGDRALLRHQHGSEAYVTDLAAQWSHHHQLPFVFARWVVDKYAPVEFRLALEEWLTTFVENETRLQRITAEQEAYRYKMRNQQVINYLSGIKTWIGDRECAGQALYLSELKKYQTTQQRQELQQRQEYA